MLECRQIATCPRELLSGGLVSTGGFVFDEFYFFPFLLFSFFFLLGRGRPYRLRVIKICFSEAIGGSGQTIYEKICVMARHDRRPRPSIGIEKESDRQGWRATSVTHTTSHIHNTLSRVSPVLTHFSLTARSSHTHTHRFLGFRNSTPGILTVFSVRLMTLLRVSVISVTWAQIIGCPFYNLGITSQKMGCD